MTPAVYEMRPEQGLAFRELLAKHAGEIPAPAPVPAPAPGRFAGYTGGAATHFNSAQDGRVPLCGARDSHGIGYSNGYYTKDAARVSCKRCLKSLAKQVK